MAHPPLCIDTDILIDFLRGQWPGAAIFEAALRRQPCALPSITVYEVCVGIERYGRQDDWRSLQRLLKLVELVPFDLEAAQASARLDAELQRTGLRIDFPDLFIAGICLARHLPLLTRNRAHFARVPHLTLVDPHQWSEEPA